MKLRYDNFLNRPQFCHAILLKYYFGMMCRKGRRRENEMTKQDKFIDFGEKISKKIGYLLFYKIFLIKNIKY